ncbi:hypothetical protein GCM10020295_02520 [Streptomyces cinereospinus]
MVGVSGRSQETDGACGGGAAPGGREECGAAPPGRACPARRRRKGPAAAMPDAARAGGPCRTDPAYRSDTVPGRRPVQSGLRTD